MKDYYTILEVSPQATESEIHAAYVRLARNFHPDGIQDRPQLAQLASEYFLAIQEAYEVLSDHESRQLYDQGRLPQSPALLNPNQLVLLKWGVFIASAGLAGIYIQQHFHSLLAESNRYSDVLRFIGGALLLLLLPLLVVTAVMRLIGIRGGIGR